MDHAVQNFASPIFGLLPSPAPPAATAELPPAEARIDDTQKSSTLSRLNRAIYERLSGIAAQVDLTAHLSDGEVASALQEVLNHAHVRRKVRDRDAARTLLLVMKAHGEFLYDHCTRLIDLALALARELGQGDEVVERQVQDGVLYRNIGEVGYFLTKQSARQKMALAAYLAGVDLAQESFLHDLGKVVVPGEILYKPGPLDPAEMAIMRQHPVWGAEILESIPSLHHAIPVVRHHHERWDGQGYPDRLGGEQIPTAARVVSVVDAFDAMVSDRPYRPALAFEEALEEIHEGAGTQFDADVTSAFLRIIDQVWSPERQY